jgi:hypothetical protein
MTVMSHRFGDGLNVIILRSGVLKTAEFIQSKEYALDLLKMFQSVTDDLKDFVEHYDETRIEEYPEGFGEGGIGE